MRKQHKSRCRTYDNSFDLNLAAVQNKGRIFFYSTRILFQRKKTLYLAVYSNGLKPYQNKSARAFEIEERNLLRHSTTSGGWGKHRLHCVQEMKVVYGTIQSSSPPRLSVIGILIELSVSPRKIFDIATAFALPKLSLTPPQSCQEE